MIITNEGNIPSTKAHSFNVMKIIPFTYGKVQFYSWKNRCQSIIDYFRINP